MKPGVSFLQQYSLFSRILPGLDQTSLYNGINFSNPFQDPYMYDGQSGAVNNATVMATSLAVFLCPSDGYETSANTGLANYRASIGFTVCWVGDSGFGQSSTSGPFGVDPSAVTDGLSNTAALSEKLVGKLSDPQFDARRYYARGYIIPYDIIQSIDACSKKTETSSGFFTTSGLSWFVGTLAHTEYSHGFPPNPADSDCLLRGVNPPMAIASARSNHPGGVNLGMADGSVRFVNDGIARSTWAALGSRAGGDDSN
jgi:prepilin-type processing-associated H-X9-DG protein